MPDGSVSTSGMVGAALGEFVATGEFCCALPLQLCSNESDSSVIEPISTMAFRADVKLR